VKEGQYQGFGFIDSETHISRLEDYEAFLKRQTSTYHTNKILSNYLRKQGSPKVIFFDNKPETPPDHSVALAKRNAAVMATHGTLSLFS